MLRELNEDMTQTVMPVTVFVGLQTVLGFFGNLIVMYVFLFRYRHCSFRYFVTCLAGIDFISSLTTLPGEIVLQNFWYTFPSNILCKTKAFFDMCRVTAEALCLLTIAVDRYRKVCKPHIQRSLTVRVIKTCTRAILKALFDPLTILILISVSFKFRGKSNISLVRSRLRHVYGSQIF